MVKYEDRLKLDLKSCRFSFTNYDLEFKYENIGDSYLIVGLETCPTTGRIHHQGYMEIPDKRSLRSVIKSLGGCHAEHSYEKEPPNTKYCSKDKNLVFERGQRKQQGKRTDLEGIRERIVEGDSLESIADDNFASWTRNHRALAIYKQWKIKKRDESVAKTVIVLWGKTGAGKTLTARRAGASIVEYLKGGYFTEEVSDKIICIDEIDKGDITAQILLKITDRYNIKVNIKGGSAWVVADTVYLCANKHPRDWDCWDDGLKRRITEIRHLKESGLEVVD